MSGPAPKHGQPTHHEAVHHVYLTVEQMEKMTTQRLLAYFKKHLMHDPFYPSSEKEKHDEWEMVRAKAQSILSSREHVPSKRELQKRKK